MKAHLPSFVGVMIPGLHGIVNLGKTTDAQQGGKAPVVPFTQGGVEHDGPEGTRCRR